MLKALVVGKTQMMQKGSFDELVPPLGLVHDTNLDHSSKANDLAIDQGVIRGRIERRDLLQVDLLELVLEELVDGQVPVGVAAAFGPENLVDDLKRAGSPINDSGHLDELERDQKI